MKIIETFFSEQARKPSGLFGRLVMSRVFELGNVVLNDFMKELLSLDENDHVLEIGSGTGKLINEMAKLVEDGFIEGIDLSNTMVAIAQKKNRKHISKGKVNIRQGDFEKMAYRNNSFDKICSANTIYFWSDPDNFIKKIYRILKPGGKLVLAFEDKNQLEKRPLSTNVFHFYSQDEIANLLQRNGFSESIDILSREVKLNRYHCAVAVR
jgi:ubiquinone/menaquinone biosynthesis C-methylase UbiE